MNQNPIKKILILVTILAVPGFLYYLLQEAGKNRYKPLPIFGEKQVANTFHSVKGKKIPDTIYHLVDDFKLVNQLNDTVTFKNYQGKVLLINLFYIGQNNGVDKAMKAMKGFSLLYEKNNLMNFASINIANGSVSALHNLTTTNGAKAGKWDLLTGDTASVYELVRKGLLLDVLQANNNGVTKFIYNNSFVLLDHQHRIRGFYEATNQEALSKLDDEIKVLIAEELRNIKDGR
jgi:protein SCO1/2